MMFADSLRAAAEALGLTLQGVTEDADDPLKYATVPSAMAIRDPLEVGVYDSPEDFYFDGWGQGVQYISGQTDGLEELARIAHAWQTGVPVRDIDAMATYSGLGHLAEAAEQGAEAVVTAGWEYLRALAQTAPWPEFQTMIEEAHAHPRLRQLFPYIGMYEVSFLEGALPFGRTLVKIVRAEEGFSVSAAGQIHHAATPGEAVALAVQLL